MDDELLSWIKAIAAMLAVILAPFGGLIIFLYRGTLYKYWNKLDGLYRKIRRKLHV